MLGLSPFYSRIGLAKIIGVVGATTGVLAIPIFFGDVDATLRWGLFLWYITVAALVGMMGIHTHIPWVNMRYSWWIRGPLVGLWLNLIAALLAWDQIATMLANMAILSGWFGSPLWFAVEGAIFGFIVDGICTAVFGDGEKLLTEPAANGTT